MHEQMMDGSHEKAQLMDNSSLFMSLQKMITRKSIIRNEGIFMPKHFQKGLKDRNNLKSDGF